MPRKPKEEIEKIENKKSANTKKATKKSTTTKASTAKTSSKKTATAKPSAKKDSTKKTSTKKTTTKKATAKKTVSKKDTTKKVSAKKKTEKKILPIEYYDLPQKYNKTVVKVLAQTPKTLFVYWEISDDDIEKFKKDYGKNFFETTRPVLIIHNDTLNYSFEVEINDFANSWYLHVADSKCDYRVELGRKPIRKTEKLDSDYIYVSTSNEIESPNDHILFDKHQKMVYFKNVKTGSQTEKSINNLSFITNMGKIYDIYDLYKGLYKSENVEGIYDSSNPSS